MTQRFETVNACLSKARENKPRETEKFWDVLLFFENEEREFAKALDLLKVGDILIDVEETSCIFLQKEPGLCFLGYSKEKKLFTENISQVKRVLCRRKETTRIFQKMDFLLAPS